MISLPKQGKLASVCEYYFRSQKLTSIHIVNSFLVVTRVHKANVKCKCIAHFCIKFSGTNGAVKMKVG